VLMLLGAAVGGYGGAYLAQKMNPQHVRRLVIVIGFAMAAYFFGAIELLRRLLSLLG
jgi:uncharacterized membrane protein YfcA